jgi:hypothetical protein
MALAQGLIGTPKPPSQKKFLGVFLNSPCPLLRNAQKHHTSHKKIGKKIKNGKGGTYLPHLVAKGRRKKQM